MDIKETAQSIIGLLIFALVAWGVYSYFFGGDIYPVKNAEVSSKDEVYVTVELNSGHEEEFICYFPPEADLEHMERVSIGEVRQEYLIGGKQHYCNVIK